MYRLPTTAGWLLLTLAASPPSGQRSYRILVDGQENGAASLSIQARRDGSFDYRWHAQIGVSRTPCLWSEEQRSGNFTQGLGHTLPDELALSLMLPDANGTVRATINGQDIHAVLGRDGLPDRVDLVEAGLTYVAAPPNALGWDRCGHGDLERGPALLGAESLQDPRQVVHATFERVDAPGGWRSVATVPAAPLPETIQRLVTWAYDRAPGRDCKLVAFDLAQALERAGLHARVVAGWIVAHGALWPHAWTELQDGHGLRALDATTSRGWADAARIRLGTLENAEAASNTGQQLLRARHTRIRLKDYSLLP